MCIRDSASVDAYKSFLAAMLERLNAGRSERLKEEMEVMRELPERRMETFKCERVKVDSGSLISVSYTHLDVYKRQAVGWILQLLRFRLPAIAPPEDADEKRLGSLSPLERKSASRVGRRACSVQSSKSSAPFKTKIFWYSDWLMRKLSLIHIFPTLDPDSS